MATCEREADHKLPSGETLAYPGCGCRHNGGGPKVHCAKCDKCIGRHCETCGLVY